MINIERFANKRDVYHAKNPNALVVLAHGAGAGNQHEFIKTVAMLLAENGFTVSALNFPYMESAYELDKKRPPNKAPQLLQALQDEVEWISKAISPSLDIFIVGKSMGGRMATLLASSKTPDFNTKIKGVVALGYPFHPPGKKEKLAERIEHFSALKVPMLIIQGERDTFGNQTLVASTPSLASIDIEWLIDGDHSFKPRKSAPVTEKQNIQTACEYTTKFILGQLP
ncbi:alpha/beta fold hydrolase [Psychrosphaera ytuae]|uniref:alpha/beta fold hydrolase n=1 Tax=Psychrosphaera ytuae TaxID=2820710 RepID=UPI001E3B7A58|nr:alpha/beta fold hydrolase [Psychrosphaera ytuae]